MKHPIWAAKMNRSNTKQVVSGGNGIDIYIYIYIYIMLLHMYIYIYIQYLYDRIIYIYIHMVNEARIGSGADQVLFQLSVCLKWAPRTRFLCNWLWFRYSDILIYIYIHDICDVYLSPIFKSKSSNSGDFNFCFVLQLPFFSHVAEPRPWPKLPQSRRPGQRGGSLSASATIVEVLSWEYIWVNYSDLTVLPHWNHG